MTKVCESSNSFLSRDLCSILNLLGCSKYFLFLYELLNPLANYLQKNLSGILNRISLNLRTSIGKFCQLDITVHF